MIYHEGYTLLDKIGLVIGLSLAVYIMYTLYNSYHNHQRGSIFTKVTIVEGDAYYTTIIFVDLVVSLFLLYLNLLASGYYFGRSLIVLIGYWLFNWGVNHEALKDPTYDENDIGYWALIVGAGIIFSALISAMSFVDYMVIFLEVLSEMD